MSVIILNEEILKDMRVRFDKYVTEKNRDPERIYIVPQGGSDDSITSVQLLLVGDYIKKGGKLPCKVDGDKVSYDEGAEIPPTPSQPPEEPNIPPTNTEVQCNGEWYDEQNGRSMRKGYTAYVNQLNRDHGDYICAIISCYHVIYELTGKDLNINDMINWAWGNWTNENGTGHDGVKAILNHFAPELQIEWRNFSNVGMNGLDEIMNNRCQAVIWHYLYQNTYGHFSSVLSACHGPCQIEIIGSLPSQAGRTKYDFETTWNWSMGISQPTIGIVTKIR
jgi:hypothetical protein